ncbi:hypothetical protein BH11PSE3_BH11PSE3_40380 [soil metagenome]
MIAFRRRLESGIAYLGLFIALAVAIGVPLGYLLVAHSRLAQELSLVAEINAGRVSKYIYLHRDLWQFHAMRLAEVIEVREARDLATRQRIYDAAGKQVLETGTQPDWPIVAERAAATVAGSTVATVEIASSLRPVLLVTALIAAISGLTGLAIIILVRTVPLRIIDRALGELAATQARYRLLFEANPFAVVVTHRHTRAFLAVNGAAVDHYGWTKSEALTMTVDDVRAPDTGAPRARDVATSPSFNSATTYRRQHRQRRKDGSLIDVELYSRAIEFDGEPAFLSLVVDVTDRNRFEEQLRQSQKMEAVGRLTGGIAHDFNNLLHVMVSHVEFLEEDEQLGAPLKVRVAKVMGALDRATDLTRQLLSFSRKQPLRAEVVRTNDVVTSTIELLQRTLGSQVEIATSLDKRLWLVEVDPTQLQATLLNLCLNARDAMPTGGKLQIVTRNATLDAAFATRHAGAAAGDFALLSVIDSGTGMDPQTLAQVFEPFFTTKKANKGTGLGLSMVYGFINQSGGFVTASSAPGGGSTFSLYLPRTQKTSLAPAIPDQPASAGGSERILVVEDQPELNAGIVEQLRSLGYGVDHAADGEEGLAAFESAAQPFDLLLTDVMMPKMNGKALAQAVSARWPETRIIFMSGYAESEVVHDGIIDANIVLLSKPFRKQDLARAVRDVLA